MEGLSSAVSNRDTLRFAMERGRNGYVTVSVGVSSGQRKPSRLPRARPHLDEDSRNQKARRLRTEGWSYRHISVALNMSYASVSNLLDGEEARLPPIPLSIPIARSSRTPTTATAPHTDHDELEDRFDQLSGQIMALQHRLDRVIAIQDSIRKKISQLESRFLAVLQREHHALGEHLQANIKTILERVLPHPTHKDTL